MTRSPASLSAPAQLWELLDERQRTVLVAAGSRHDHPVGTVILSEGAPSGCALILLAGRVKVLATGLGGRQSVLAIRVPGDVLGELAAIDGKPRSATVIAVDAVRVLRIPAATFNAILHTHPGIAHAVLRVVASRLRMSDRRRVEYSETTVAQRVAATLAELAAEEGALLSTGLEITLPYSQEELAKMVCGSREAVVRALGELRRQGVIATGRRRIIVRQPEVLGHCAVATARRPDAAPTASDTAPSGG